MSQSDRDRENTTCQNNVTGGQTEAVEQLWVTTRPHLGEELGDELPQLSYTQEPLSKEDQVELLKKFWILRDWFTGMNNKEKEEKENKLVNYAKDLIKNIIQSVIDRDKEFKDIPYSCLTNWTSFLVKAEDLIKKLGQEISDKNIEFTGIPLKCRMLADAFDKEVRTLCLPDESMSELPLIRDLYGQFIERHGEGSEVSANNTVVTEQREIVLQYMNKNFRLSLKVLFTEKYVTPFQFITSSRNSDKGSSTSGVAHLNNGDKINSIRRTFEEFYFAEFFVNQLTKGTKAYQEVQDSLLKGIFLEEYRLFRCFVDGLISMSELTNEVLKQHGNRIHELLKGGALTLHKAASEGNACIIEVLLNSLHVAGHEDTLIKLLGPQNAEMQTAWYPATVSGKIQVLEKLWGWVEKNLAAHELNKKYLLHRDSEGKTVWHVAAKQGNLEVLQQLWEWAKKRLTAEELNDKLLLARDGKERTALHLAAQTDEPRVLQKLCEWADEKLKPQEVNDLLLAEDSNRQTAWHVASGWGRLQVLQKLWEMTKERLKTKDLQRLLSAQDKSGNTACHIAAEKGKLEILQQLLEWAQHELPLDDLGNKFLLVKNIGARTAWHVAAKTGELEMLQKLWDWAKNVSIPDELRKGLLLAEDNKGKTAWHVAAKKGELELLEKLWDWAKEVLTADDINNNLLLARDENDQTFLHVAAKMPDTNTFEELLCWATQKLSLEVKKKLSSARDRYNQTVLNVATDRHNTIVSQKLKEWESKNFLHER